MSHLPGGNVQRRLRKLQKISDDPRWATIAANVEQLKNPRVRYAPPIIGNFSTAQAGYSAPPLRTPTAAAVSAYLDAAETVLNDIRTLANRS